MAKRSWQSCCQATVAHGGREWAWDANGDGQHEVHCNSYEGAGAALRTYLRAFRVVHKRYLYLDVATDKAIVNTQRVTPQLIRRMCIVNLSMHIGYT